MSSSPPNSPNGADHKPAPTVVVVIVNYCTADLVIDCLRSLSDRRRECPDMVTVVVDNASPDGSGARIAGAIAENDWRAWARLKPMPRNGGFSYGNNGVIRDYLESGNPPDYFWLLNSDTVVRPGALSALLSFMKEKPDAGILGSRLEHPDGTPQHSAFRFHSIAGEFEASVNVGVISKMLRGYQVAPPIPDRVQPFDWLSGASMLIRRQVLEDAGLFDESYFLYYEETDFCIRAKAAGWHCWYVPESRVVHLVGASTGVTGGSDRTRRRPSYWFESRRHYYVKHHGRLHGSMADLALAAGTLLWMTRACIERRSSLCPEKFLTDLARHTALLNRTEATADSRAR
jgi:N-acetylglucosaminyl-diphospho-decaprenol L-rhamnosyltransferase